MNNTQRLKHEKRFGPPITKKDLIDRDIWVGNLVAQGKMPLWTEWTATLPRTGDYGEWHGVIDELAKVYDIEEVLQIHSSAVIRFRTIDDTIAFRLRFGV